jgi:hypothetical protein
LDDVDGLLLDFLPVQLMKNPMLLKYLSNWTLMPMAVRKSWTVPLKWVQAKAYRLINEVLKSEKSKRPWRSPDFSFLI